MVVMESFLHDLLLEKVNRTGESTHSWWKPLLPSRTPRTPLAEWSRGLCCWRSLSAWMARTSPFTVLKLLRTCHRPACLTLLNAFLKSVKLWNRSCWCRSCFSMNDDSTTEDLFYCAPAWPKTWLFSCQQFLSLGLEPVHDNLEHELLGWLIRLTVW